MAAFDRTELFILECILLLGIILFGILLLEKFGVIETIKTIVLLPHKVVSGEVKFW